jgi:signal transduction histidine kinase/CheY-like chemotaxis protein
MKSKTNKYKKARVRENRRKMQIWLLSFSFVVLVYCSLLYIEALFLGDGDMSKAYFTILGGLPLLILALIIVFKFPEVVKAPIYMAILTQLVFIGVGVFKQDMDFYFFIILLIVGTISVMKNFKHLLVCIAIMTAINIAAFIFFFPHLQWLVDDFRLFMRFMMFLCGSLFFLLQTYGVEQKEHRSDRAFTVFSALLRNTPNYMVITNSKGQVRFLSDAMAEFMRCPRKEFAVGRPLVDLVSERNLKIMFADILDSEGFYKTVIPIYIKGEECYMKIISDKLPDEIGGQFIDISDITDMVKSHMDAKDAQIAAVNANNAKSQFLATMSHEIRTPMNGIIGFSELALDDDIPPKTRDYLEKIKLSASGLLKIINDILDISKIEAGKLSFENIPFDIHEVLETCRTIIQPKAEEKGIALFCYAEPSIHGRLLGDPTRLRQVLLNLLSNAVKFTHTGTVKLLTAVMDYDADSVTMYFEVRDSGIGMTPEQTGKLFQSFTQADSSITRKYGGTGLGLTIAKNIVELMDGTMRVESVPGLGSRFSFELTFKTLDKSREISEAQHDAIRVIEKPTFEGEILICEDNAINQQVISDHLSRVGLDFVIAANGKEGVEHVQHRINSGEKPFGLIFMDIHMPVMDGLDASEQLVRIGCETPIVALTANIMANDKEAYRKVGMTDSLGKPFTAQELWGCLLKYFTPVSTSAVNEKEQMSDDEKLLLRLRKNFLEDNRESFKDLTASLESGDIKSAYRIAHTLKGIAGTLGEKKLRRAAYEVEYSLQNEKNDVNEKQLARLETELNSVIDGFTRIFEGLAPEDGGNQKIKKKMDSKQALNLITQLGVMLKIGDSDCMDFIDDLRAIPETEELIYSMEHFDFAAAYEMLITIKQKLEAEYNVDKQGLQ